MANSRTTRINSPNSSYSTLESYLSRVSVIRDEFLNNSSVAVSSAQFVKLGTDTETVLAGSHVAVGTGTTQYGGLVCAGGATIGTASAALKVTDTYGNIANLIEVRDDVSKVPVIDPTSGQQVFGLLQTSAADGTATAVFASSNLQISFVIFTTADSLSLVSVNQTIEFQLNKAVAEKNVANYVVVGGNPQRDVQNANSMVQVRKFVATVAYAAGETIDLTTGVGSIAGTATIGGANITIQSTASLFDNEGRIRVRLLGEQLERATVGTTTPLSQNYVSWIAGGSTATGDPEISFNFPIDIGDYWEVETPASY